LSGRGDDCGGDGDDRFCIAVHYAYVYFKVRNSWRKQAGCI